MKLAGAILVALAMTWGLARPPPKPGGQDYRGLLLPKPEFLRIAFRPFLTLVADYYWLRAIQQSGVARTAAEYRDAAALAELVTTLDPDFEYVYFFGGAIAPVNLGREQWVNIEESTRLLERGVARFPNNVQLRVLLAYNISQFEKDYERAARLLEETARLPGAPPYLMRLATRLYSASGKFDVALDLATSLAEDAGDEGTRQLFEVRRKELLLEQRLRSVERAAARFASDVGRYPLNLLELVGRGYLSQTPSDPFGGEIVIEEGAARSTSGVQRLQLYDPHEN